MNHMGQLIDHQGYFAGKTPEANVSTPLGATAPKMMLACVFQVRTPRRKVYSIYPSLTLKGSHFHFEHTTDETFLKPLNRSFFHIVKLRLFGPTSCGDRYNIVQYSVSSLFFSYHNGVAKSFPK